MVRDILVIPTTILASMSIFYMESFISVEDPICGQDWIKNVF